MPKRFDVHLYAVVRIKTPGIEATSQQEAIKKACDIVEPRLNDGYLFHTPGNLAGGISVVEYAEEIVNFLVDEEGDEEHERTTWYEPDGVTVDKKFKGSPDA